MTDYGWDGITADYDPAELLDVLLAEQQRLQLGQAGTSDSGAAARRYEVELEDVKKGLGDVQKELMVFRLEKHKASQTTRTEKEIGKEYLKTAGHLESSTAKLNVLSSTQLAAVRRACVMLTSHRTFGARVQAKAAADGKPLSEEAHMQPLGKSLMENITKAVGSERLMYPVDTHKRGLHPNANKGQIDISIMACSENRLWSNLVTFMEFKLHTKDLDAAVGQVIARASLLFEHQPRRSLVYALVLSLDTVRLCCIRKQQGGTAIHLDITEHVSLELGSGEHARMCTGNMRGNITVEDLAAGVLLIARLLATPLDKLGYKPPIIPVEHEEDGSARLQDFQFVRQGTRVDGVGSTVYQARLVDRNDPLRPRDVIVKMGCSPREIDILKRLRDPTNMHCIKLVEERSSGTWVQYHDGIRLCTAVLAPVCEALQRSSSLEELVQVAADIAAAIRWLLARNIMHRDISANNIGIFQGRGVLFDFSAAKVVQGDEQHSEGGAPHKVTGTPLFVAYSLLAEGSNVHTESTHLESLYYSVWYSIAGKLPDEQAFRDYSSMRMWAAMRRGIMSGSEPLRGVKEEVRPFLWELHQLFWPGHGNRNLMPVEYKTDVTVDQFLAVCMNYFEGQPPGGVRGSCQEA